MVTLNTHARRNWLLFANWQRGTFNLHVGCANTQGTFAILSPDSQGKGGQPKHEACCRTRESNPQPTGLKASVLTPKPNCSVKLDDFDIKLTLTSPWHLTSP